MDPCLHHGTQWHAARLVHPPWSARQTGDVLHASTGKAHVETQAGRPKHGWNLSEGLIDLPNTQKLANFVIIQHNLT